MMQQCNDTLTLHLFYTTSTKHHLTPGRYECGIACTMLSKLSSEGAYDVTLCAPCVQVTPPSSTPDDTQQAQKLCQERHHLEAQQGFCQALHCSCLS